MTLPAVITNGIACVAGLLDQGQRPSGRGLINANRIGQLRRGQVWRCIEKLQCRILRGMKATAGEHLLVKHRDSSGGLPERGAVTRK